MVEFAQGRLEECPEFARRVRQFEKSFGAVDDSTLGVLAQTAFFCYFEVEYRQDFLHACRAIGMGSPTSQYSCCQLSPARWEEVNAYVVGVHSWLSAERPVSPDVDGATVRQINEWLGSHHKAKVALAELLLERLIGHLWSAELALLGGDTPPDPRPYPDYRAWYVRPDGTYYARGDWEETSVALSQSVRDAMGETAAEAEKLIQGITRETQPPCMHRFTRYMDIQVTSIGALKWRGRLPSQAEPKTAAGTWLDTASAAVRAWAGGRAVEGQVAERIHGILGEPTEGSRAIARDFLLAAPPGSGFFDWLRASTREAGTRADAIFRPD